MFTAIYLFFLTITGTKIMTSPAELAAYTKCQPDRIAHWIGQRIAYKEQAGWQDAETCMIRGNGDCKCMAVVARDTLAACAGYEPRVMLVKGGKHAVCLFTDHLGRRGYIDGINFKRFDASTSWGAVYDGL